MSSLNDEKRAADALEVLKAAQKQWEDYCLQAKKEIDSADAQLAEIKEALGDAAEANDLTAFQVETAKLASAETALQMAEMRYSRLKEKGFADEKTIDAGIRMYEAQVARINERACKSIFDTLTSLIQTVDAANKEARQILKREKELCELCGVEFDPVMRKLTVDSAIFAADIVRRYKLKCLLLDSNLQRFASQIHSSKYVTGRIIREENDHE